MSNSRRAERDRGSPRERLHDVLITAVLAGIWGSAVFVVWRSDTEIPLSMLAIGTIFFVLLMPAMKELVKLLDRWLRRELGLADAEEADEQRQ